MQNDPRKNLRQPQLLSLLAVLFPTVSIAFESNHESIPESENAICGSAEVAYKLNCSTIYKKAIAGDVQSALDIGQSVMSRRDPVGTGTSFFEVEIAAFTRAEKWFQYAKSLAPENNDAKYWLAMSKWYARSSAIWACEFSPESSRSETIERLFLPTEMAEYKSIVLTNSLSCANSGDPRCMHLLSELHAAGYAVSQSRVLAAEWQFKSAMTYVENGDRTSALESLEELKKKYPDYPYIPELQKRLFPPLPSLEEHGRKNAPSQENLSM